jgi:hypothetical protein
LIVAPFSLVQGASIFSYVIATNQYGDSLPSSPGNGAMIAVVPQPPV